jgi:mRNA-degrading endonuclease RelE of RelBE toxin-antitoxin system
MAVKRNYLVQIVPEVQHDLSKLPVELQENWQQYQKVLAIDPHHLLGLPSHNLTGKLRGCRAIDIHWHGISYRLVYQIYEKPSPKRVVILSFAEHDPAYEKAKKRKSGQ